MEDIKQVVRESYGRKAEHAADTVEGAKRVAEAFGYSKEDLDSVPNESNMGLSCGNPIALASLKPGEVVLDLGSGGGLDCFLAATKVGDKGKVIGVDMTPSMISLARANAKKAGKDNVRFLLGEIEALPVERDTVDCAISNCVINLSSDKQLVFHEIYRVLKPGGRVAVSDICLKKDLPPLVTESVLAYVGCIAGAHKVDEYKDMLSKAGFLDIDIIDSHSDLNIYTRSGVEDNTWCCASSSPASQTQKSSDNASCFVTSCCESLGIKCSSAGDSQQQKQKSCAIADSSIIRELLKKYDVNEYAGSYLIYAIKPL